MAHPTSRWRSFPFFFFFFVFCGKCIIDYNIPEGNESFTFILSEKANGNGTTFAPGQIVVTVHIKDPCLPTTLDTLVTTPIVL